MVRLPVVYCTVSVTEVDCESAPEPAPETAMMVTVLEPAGVPEFELDEELPLPPQDDNPSIVTAPSRTSIHPRRLFL